MGIWKKLVGVARDFNSSYEETRDAEKQRKSRIDFLERHPEYACCRQCKYFVDGSGGIFGCEPFCRNELNEYWDSNCSCTVHPTISDPDHNYCNNFKYGQG